jgi:uncharacterized protein YqgV (UPF0045/DUF77 family)
MSFISAQISVYPLGTDDLSEKIDRFIQSLADDDLVVHVGPMSSYIGGESDRVFEALRRAFDEIAAGGEVVLTATFSNACPAWFTPVERAKKERP